MTCCKQMKEENSKPNKKNPKLTGMEFKHMKSPCKGCFRLFFMCQLYTLDGTHLDPTCIECVEIMRDLK